MHRPIVWITGAALLAVVIATLLVQGATREPAAGRSAPRVVVRSPSHAPTHEAARELGGPGSPEVVVLGDLAPTRAARAPAPAPRGATSRPRVVHEIVYVDAPAAEPVSPPMSVATAAPEVPVEPAPEVAMAPAELPSTLPAPPPVEPVPAERGPSRAGGIVTGAAIGAGIGAVLGGSRGALRGAIGGAAGGAIGGRSGGVLGGVLGGIGGRGRTTGGGGCYRDSVFDYAYLTP